MAVGQDCILYNITISLGLVITTPSELVKCIQQLETTTHLKTSVILRDIIRLKGYLGVFRGYCVTFNRDLIGLGLYFCSYYKMRDYGEEMKILSTLFLLMIGGFAGNLKLK